MCKITKEDRKEFIGQVIDVFEDFLDKKGIIISNDERDIDSDLEPEGSTNIYGNDYDSIREKLEKLFINWSVLEDERLRAQCRNMGRFQPVDCPHPECRCTNVADAIRHRRTCANRRPVDNDMLKN